MTLGLAVGRLLVSFLVAWWGRKITGERLGENNRRGNVDLRYRRILYRLSCKIEWRNEKDLKEGYEVKKDFFFNDVCMLLGWVRRRD